MQQGRKMTGLKKLSLKFEMGEIEPYMAYLDIMPAIAMPISPKPLAGHWSLDKRSRSEAALPGWPTPTGHAFCKAPFRFPSSKCACPSHYLQPCGSFFALLPHKSTEFVAPQRRRYVHRARCRQGAALLGASPLGS